MDKEKSPSLFRSYKMQNWICQALWREQESTHIHTWWSTVWLSGWCSQCSWRPGARNHNLTLPFCSSVFSSQWEASSQPTTTAQYSWGCSFNCSKKLACLSSDEAYVWKWNTSESHVSKQTNEQKPKKHSKQCHSHQRERIQEQATHFPNFPPFCILVFSKMKFS